MQCCHDRMTDGGAMEPAGGAGGGKGNSCDRGFDHDDILLLQHSVVDEGYDSPHESVLNAAFSRHSGSPLLMYGVL
jgi:hypothetical protein